MAIYRYGIEYGHAMTMHTCIAHTQQYNIFVAKETQKPLTGKMRIRKCGRALVRTMSTEYKWIFI